MSNQSPVVGLVMSATNPNNPADDWDSILQLSDLLSQNPDENTKQVIQPLNSRLSDGNVQTVMYALTLADALLKNTNDYVKNCFIKSEFLSIVHGIASNNRSKDLSDKAKDLIKENRLPGPSSPQQQPLTSSTQLPPPPFRGNAPSSPSTNERHERGRINLKTSGEKLDADLNVVKENILILSQLVEAASNPNELREDDTASQVRANCDEMNRRIVSLIELIPEEQTLLKLLDIHEQLNDGLLAFDKYMKTGQKEAPKVSLAHSNSSAPPMSPSVNTQQASSGFGALASRNKPKSSPTDSTATNTLSDHCQAPLFYNHPRHNSRHQMLPMLQRLHQRRIRSVWTISSEHQTHNLNKHNPHLTLLHFRWTIFSE